MRRFMFIFLLFIFMSLGVANSHQQPPSNIVFYLHIGQSTVLLASNRSTASSGVAALLDATVQSITLSAENNTALGTLRALSVLVGTGSLEAVMQQGEVVLATIDYDDGSFKGSINLQGHFSAADRQAEVAVVGGTHAFRRVQGYGNPSIIAQSSHSIVVRWELHLFYPKA